ncbi:hypothetical protein G6671_03910 [Polynucleobacter paneuropaeus]|nr:hypothetical protein G6723_03565 [Polynucleobacter paneuropaeus]QWD37931.1 hypothetical protein G6671_03910 [Polynucleobacter paneuropaeus]
MSQIPTSILSHAYPNLTVANNNELRALLEHLQMTLIDHGNFPSHANDWPIIEPSGNSSPLCSRNILSIGGDKSSFYKQRWKNVYSLEEASVYLLDYYERCKHITKLGVLLTDVWRPSTLSRWSHIYEMYEAMGIQSVALLYSGHQITPIRWPWR